ncbi:hypothetical protein HN011_008095 [Eciton burchellii]|nr:hypothetical protein HN011_008095 [Eciton burchellii]
MDTSRLKQILKNNLSTFEVPVLFKNMLQKSDGSYEWKLLQWDIHDFMDIFGEKQLSFRIGDHNKRTCTIQQDQCSIQPPIETIQLTFRQFINKTYESKDDKWFYCDYKHMIELFSDKPEIIESFNWLKFGIDESIGKNGLHSTIWIGSKGAHTDCHWDTYGYNLVAQVFGRKLWLLYPPNDALMPVRVPYEESTVYSRFNIYCPSDEEECYLLKNVPVKPKLIVLEPGDVLFVPNGWWHYVESLDSVNISVNIWGEIKTDEKARVKEALVQLLVAKIANVKSEDDINADSYYYTKTVESAIIEYKEAERRNNRQIPEEKKSNVAWTAKHLTEIYPHHVKLLEDAEHQEFKKFLRERRERNKNIKEQKETKEGDIPQFDPFLENLINALCHPDVVNKAAEILLKKFS